MIENAQSVVRWVRDRWHQSGALVRVGSLLLAVIAVTVLIYLTPFAFTFKELFSRANPNAQTFIVMGLLVGWTLFLLFSWQRASRVDELKEANDQLKARLNAAEQEAKQHQERWDHLLTVECRDIVWNRPSSVAVPAFVPRLNRKTRFVTVLNLKGGVGKTTLTANLAGCLGAGHQPLRILLIDIDFQGTLGDATVEESHIAIQRQNGSCINQLLTESEPGDGLIERLGVGMCGLKSTQVILADDSLELDEFQLHARFFVDTSAEPRFRFRTHLHRPPVFDRFDLVLFDCPPRITPSVVNAIASSDYVLIPTRLDRGSVDAVPRTIGWLRSLSAVSQAEVIGVVASHAAVRVGNLTKGDRASYETLQEVVESECGANVLFRSVVPSSPHAIGPERGRVASLTPEGRTIFAPVADELRKRMQI